MRTNEEMILIKIKNEVWAIVKEDKIEYLSKEAKEYLEVINRWVDAAFDDKKLSFEKKLKIVKDREYFCYLHPQLILEVKERK